MEAKKRSRLEEARRSANKITVKRIGRKVDADADIDLPRILQQQIEAYPELIETLADIASDSGEESCQDEANDSSLPSLPTTGTLVLVAPLDDRLLDFVGVEYDKGATQTSSEEFLRSFLIALNSKLQTADVLHELNGTRVLSLGSSIVVKIGLAQDQEQITNLLHVHSRCPEIPIPECLGAFRRNDETYFFMTRALGVTLESIWPQLQSPQKSSIQRQLAQLFKHLRNCRFEDTPDVKGLGSFEEGICKDTRRQQRVSRHVIRTEDEFNNFLFTADNRKMGSLMEAVRSSMRNDHRIVMTHGDLHPRNIIVEWTTVDDSSENEDTKDLKISAIIDWDMAGWYPEYWEYLKALNTITPRGPLRDWADFLPTEAIGSYATEYAMDCLIDRWLGQ